MERTLKYPKIPSVKCPKIIHENNMQELSDSLSALKELPRGDACINYVNGVHALSKGQLQKSLEQVTARQNADRILSSL